MSAKTGLLPRTFLIVCYRGYCRFSARAICRLDDGMTILMDKLLTSNATFYGGSTEYCFAGYSMNIDIEYWRLGSEA